ncbi:MAG: tyrosine--tRNA ligase, partial [Nanoarchaeota archaeon]
MNFDEKLELIKRNVAEIISEDDLISLLKKKKKPSVYLGTAITGSPHLGYFVWAIKLADFLKAGFKVKILLADVHGALDNTPWDVLDRRYKYYEKIIPLLFDSIGVDTKNLDFVKGSSFQLKGDYVLDLLKLSSYVTIHDGLKSASEVVKMGDNPKISGLIYPLMQSLDEEYLGVDVQYGGLDQRKIFVLAGEILPKIKYDKRIHVMTPLLPGLTGKKMSASDPKSKIDLTESEEDVGSKIRNAECVAGDIENGLLAFLKHVIFVIKKDKKEKFVVERDEKYGGDKRYENYLELEKDFSQKKIHPLDLKNALAKEINILLKPMRKNHAELSRLKKNAYG